MIRIRITDKLKELYSYVETTYGYITKYLRKENQIEKSHINDAFIISGGINQERCQEHNIQQRRRNNRSLQLNRKGFKPSIRKRRYSLQPGALVKYLNKLFKVVGVHCKGMRVIIKDIKDIKNKLVKNKSVNIKDVKLIQFSTGFNYI
jgi:hypothetical protein